MDKESGMRKARKELPIARNSMYKGPEVGKKIAIFQELSEGQFDQLGIIHKMNWRIRKAWFIQHIIGQAKAHC